MSDDDEYKRQMEIQRKNFEAQFGSLEELGYDDKTKQSDTESISDEKIESDESGESESEENGSEESDDDSEEDSDEVDFKGFDDDDSKSQEPQPKVIKFTDPTSSTYTQPTKQQRKLLKSGKSSLAPKPIQLTKQSKNQKSLPEESENLQNDLELQRFLDESHILSNFQNQQSGADLTLATLDHESGPIGKARTHTLKSRLEKISGTNGVSKSKLEKMPMSMRKGMIKSHIDKINKFEQDAKDGGIVLSKVKKGEFRNIGGRSVTKHERIGKGMGNKNQMKRSRGLQIQSVGKSTRNGLVISQSEIDRINGPSKQGGKFGKRR